MNAISYSLFGYNKDQSSGFGFRSFLRDLNCCLRMNCLIYPGWVNVLSLDVATYESEFKPIFDHLAKTGWAKLNVHSESQPLCKSMLWRLEPVWMDYEWVICRDIDSLGCYKEAAAVQVWMDNGTKTAHTMTDSVSHNIPLMGGMCGFKSNYLRDRMACDSFFKLMALGTDFDFNTKGTDQLFLSRVVLPGVNDSICEHYFLGSPQSFRGMCFVGENIVDNIVVRGINPDLKESNHLFNHIGQAGFPVDNALKFFDKWGVLKNELSEIEKEFKHIYYWEA